MRCNKNRYQQKNPVDKLLRYLSFRLKSIGVKVTYSALLLFYAYNRSDTPRWAKNIILGSLAYLLSPIDAVPDLTPLLGFTDDLGVLSYGLVSIACYINEDVRIASKNKIKTLFKEFDEEILLDVDSKL
ncbi:MAG: YkvA family protein [Saprospiraceae bacterium]